MFFSIACLLLVVGCVNGYNLKKAYISRANLSLKTKPDWQFLVQHSKYKISTYTIKSVI